MDPSFHVSSKLSLLDGVLEIKLLYKKGETKTDA